MSNNVKNIVFVASVCLGCAGVQAAPLVSLPTPDAGTGPVIDRDAYVVNIPDAPTTHQPAPADSRQYPLNRGQAAPFSGVLLNDVALAFIETEYSRLNEQCRIDRTADQQRINARALADLENWQISYNAREQEWGVIVHGRDAEINRLYELTRSNSGNRNQIWWLLGGTLIGVGVAGIITILVH
jgi:hypothetical protein